MLIAQRRLVSVHPSNCREHLAWSQNADDSDQSCTQFPCEMLLQSPLAHENLFEEVIVCSGAMISCVV